MRYIGLDYGSTTVGVAMSDAYTPFLKNYDTASFQKRGCGNWVNLIFFFFFWYNLSFT